MYVFMEVGVGVPIFFHLCNFLKLTFAEYEPKSDEGSWKAISEFSFCLEEAKSTPRVGNT